MPAIEHFWAVIPAGGSGTRLWPLSRSGSPKFLHDLTGSGRSLLQDTVARLEPLVEDRLMVVTGAAHLTAVADQLPGVARDRLVAEPSPRDSMAAIGLAAALLEREGADVVMGSFAADHVIGDAAAFQSAVGLAVEAARDDWLVTLGIEPSFPSTAFGYIRQGGPLSGHDGVFAVEAFVEKPSVQVAERYLAAGDHRWNAGMFVVRPRVLLDLLAEGQPGFAADLRDLAAAPARLAEVWPRLPRIAIDHAVAEPAAATGRVATVPADLGWDDIGDYASLSATVARATDDDVKGLLVLGDDDLVVADDSAGLVVPSSGRLVVVVGLDDIVIVDTPDALLVTTRERAQDVKEIVARLKESGRGDLT
ncbi:MAG: mannose-phosphate guanylyltransferase [Nocardioidaceae bacterium]|jgi:mannose-1-phosphate guanylyltransferase|nr:mannose-phosphate guanylyltransferase [Nocardioidaceae bacterium]